MNVKDRKALLGALQARFGKHPQRHEHVAWARVLGRIEGSAALLGALQQMEATGGEPDVLVEGEGASAALAFYDCSPESPAGRRSLCYDRAALDERKENKPGGCVAERAAEIGAALLSEEQYRHLQRFGEFDLKTSSWVATPAGVRALGGALFCDRRYGRVFVYHNGASSYYAARGFRTRLPV